MNENIVRMFNSASHILVAVSRNARIDGVASALALALAAISQGKGVTVSTEAQTGEAGRLVGSDKISQSLDLGGNVLKVSFPYSDGAIDKVTYNITDDRFNLLIEPRKGTAPLSSENVKYSYTGGQVDLIVTIDTPNLEALGNIYLENPDVFARDKIVNIDRRFDNKEYGAENMVEKQASSTAELILRLLETLRWDINPDIATNLYAGLSAATNNFTSFSTNAGSFETASKLLKYGARKVPMGMARARPATPAFGTGPVSGFEEEAAETFGGQPTFRPTSPPQPATQPTRQPDRNVFQSREPAVEEPSSPPQPQQPEPQDQESQGEQKEDQKKPPQDWLKPKIFKSTDLI